MFKSKQAKRDEALAKAARHGHGDAVRKLLSEGARADTAGAKNQWPAACCAASEGHLEILEQLRSADPPADLEARDKFGYTPIIGAACRGRADCLSALLRWGVEKDAVEAAGNSSALILAVKFGRLDCARLLVEAGADQSLKDAKGKSALDIASEKNQADMVALLGGTPLDSDVSDSPEPEPEPSGTAGPRPRSDVRTGRQPHRAHPLWQDGAHAGGIDQSIIPASTPRENAPRSEPGAGEVFVAAMPDVVVLGSFVEGPEPEPESEPEPEPEPAREACGAAHAA